MFITKFYLPIALAVATLVFMIPVAAASAPLSDSDAEYLTHLAEAIGELEESSYLSANQLLSAAYEHRRNDPLAYFLRGVLFLQCGAYADASGAFADAERLGGDPALAAYGQAMCLAGQRSFSPAIRALPRPGALISGTELLVTRAYLSLLENGRANLDSLPQDDRRVMAMKAWVALRQDRAAAEPLLAALLPEDWVGPRLESGVVMGMDPSLPLQPLGSSADAARVSGRDDPSLAGYSGRVRLRASNQATPTATYFLFYVDDSLAGIVNSTPYEITWDTTKFANGVHTIRIRGQNEAGVVVGETTQDVLVNNLAPEEGEPIPGPAAEMVLTAIRDILMLRPSVTWSQYELAQIYEVRNRSDAAMLCYERILAHHPFYRDVAQRWTSLAKFTAMQPVWKGGPGSAGPALTFDDGPNEGTRALLAALRADDLRATFFVVGAQARRNPEMLLAIAEDGHELASHSENHIALNQMDEAGVIRELFGPISVIHALTGKTPRFFRPPGGHLSTEQKEIAARFGLTPVMWTANCGPYEGGPVAKMEEYVASAAAPGAIVLMHNAEATTLRALPGIARSLKARGKPLMTLSEITR